MSGGRSPNKPEQGAEPERGMANGGSAEKGPWARGVSLNRVCPIMPKFDR